MFVYEKLPRVTGKRVTVNGKRYYSIKEYQKPLVYLPSVTTLLYDEENPSLEDWRQRVGTFEAEKITAKAAKKGTLFHDHIEHYLLNKELPINPKEVDMNTTWQLKSFKKMLDKHVGLIYGVEQFCFSTKLGIAGTTDLVANWDHIKSVIDHKTSKRKKSEAWIRNYFLQMTAYGLMIEEMHNIQIPQIVVAISAEDEPVPQIFVRNKNDYVDELFDRIKKYGNNHPEKVFPDGPERD